MTASAKQHKILIVDDVLENIKVLVHALEPEYKLSVATNGKDALRIANSGKPPDLILLDIMMPGMDGYEVFRRLKSREDSARIPVVFLTAKSQDIDEELGLELGAVDYITKPFSLPIVKARVKSQIDRKKAEETELKLERLGAIAELASGVAHHFNNMLQVIMGGASVALIKLEQGDLATSKAMLQQIIESSRFGAHTVHRLQEFVKMRTGSRDVTRDQVFDLSNTAQRSIEATKGSWNATTPGNGMTVNVVADLANGCYVTGNETEMFAVIVNLIRNAVEAMPKGGELRIATAVIGKQVQLQLKDTGIGIPNEHLHDVFEPFFTTKGYQRVGMGLASSFGIVKSHGGTILAESDQGRGAVFTVMLPLSTGEAEEQLTVSSPSIPVRLRILVIDDVEPITRMLAEMLAEFGHEVVTCLSGEHGLREFCLQPIDMVICDLGMPEMNGWEVGAKMKKLCAESNLDKPPFILLTGWGGQAEETQKMEESGVDAVVEKPLDPSRMYAVIQELAFRNPPQDRAREQNS
jgi:two-component system, cell cycle sensor histidine kinase and response regulator CckA